MLINFVGKTYNCLYIQYVFLILMHLYPDHVVNPLLHFARNSNILDYYYRSYFLKGDTSINLPVSIRSYVGHKVFFVVGTKLIFIDLLNLNQILNINKFEINFVIIKYSANMTSIVSSMPTFSDLPIDIITYILSLCECNLKEECNVLKFNTKKGRLMKVAGSHQQAHSLGEQFITPSSQELFKKSPTCLGPVFLSKVAGVCRDFKIACAPLWKTIYIHHIRNDKEFKRIYTPEQFKKKYHYYIQNNERVKLNFILEQHKYHEIMTMVKSNNAARYFQIIKQAVEEDRLNSDEVYEISGLLQYSRFSRETNYVREVSLRLRNIDNVIHYRRKAIQERDYFKKIVSGYEKCITKSNMIIDSLR